MNTIVIKALAKINLAIDVLGRRDDGYHNIDMVTIPLKLHDSIEVTPLPHTSRTYLVSDDPTIICDESNLAFQAFHLMNEKYKINGAYKIFIYKKIPVEAGLGGGSADAAAVLHAFNTILSDDKARESELSEIGLNIGSDIPFCLLNKPARVEGKGEKLTPVKVKYPYHVLIVKPDVGLSTAEIYRALDGIDVSSLPRPHVPALIEGLEKDDHDLICENMINILTVPAVKALPLIQDILEQFAMMGLDLCGMSGTGSACFALSKDKKALEKVSRFFEKQGYETCLTEFAI